MIGFDRNDAALTYLRRRLARRKLQAVVFSADMADFRLPERRKWAQSTPPTTPSTASATF